MVSAHNKCEQFLMPVLTELPPCTKPPAGTGAASVTMRQVHTLPGLTIEKAPLSCRPLSPLRGKLRLGKAQKLPQATLVVSNGTGPPTRTS